ncbi:DUF2339 domain-containing protein [Flavisolibacter ginsengisoli]|nr:DUF2339 domain-containing protein [Flavisolibacter ginsengisoli]
MNSREEIEKMQQELQELHRTIKQQQEQIILLYNKLGQLGGKTHVVQKKVQFSLENFIGLKLIHIIGIIVLVIGLSIGVKYAIDKDLISEGMRIGLAYGAGLILCLLSARLKSKYLLFSAILFSGGMASIYFTTYGAFVYYSMMPFSIAFIIMILLTVFVVYQALVYNHEEIALLGLVGAYAIPFLISKNSDKPELLFLYITVINIGTIYLGIKRPWKNVGRIAQAVTWVLFLAWAASRYNVKDQWVGYLFMVVFYLLFVFNALSGKISGKVKLQKENFYQLLLNNLALYIGSLFISTPSMNVHSLALVTFINAVVAAILAVVLYSVWKEKQSSLIIGAFAFFLFILFIAFQWTGLTVTFLWLLVALLLFAAGVMRKLKILRMGAIVLLGITLFKLVLFDSLTFTTVQKVISYLVLGILLLVVSYLYQKYRHRMFNEEAEN